MGLIRVIIFRRNCDFSEGEVGLTCKSGTDLIPEFDKYNVKYLKKLKLYKLIESESRCVVCIFVQFGTKRILNKDMIVIKLG